MSNSTSLPNYFEFYELPIQFNPDLNLVKTKFYENSKKFHPDFYANELEEKQNEVLELSTLNNKAYQVLSNSTKRLKYVLELTNTVLEDEQYQLPQAFLMDMMDINEALMELEFDANAEKLVQLNKDVDALETQLNHSLLALTEKFDQDVEKDNVLTLIKDVYYRKKYIARIRERMPKA
jgi:molecular chaperone HscB